MNRYKHFTYSISLYSPAEWRPLGNYAGFPTPASNIQGSRQTQCALTHDSESCSLLEALQSFGDRSKLISHLQICTQPRGRSKQSWPLHCESNRERNYGEKKKFMTEIWHKCPFLANISAFSFFTQPAYPVKYIM